MNDRYLINFSLFCKRKNFSLYNYLLKNKELNYRSISEIFRNKGVMPPSEVLFESIKSKIEEQSNLQVKDDINNTVLEKPKQIEKPLEDIPEKVATPKKRRSRRKKKIEQD